MVLITGANGLNGAELVIKGIRAFFAPAGRGPISIVDVRDIAQVVFASLTQSGHENKIYDITGSQSLTHAQMAAQLSDSSICPRGW